MTLFEMELQLLSHTFLEVLANELFIQVQFFRVHCRWRNGEWPEWHPNSETKSNDATCDVPVIKSK